VDCNHDYPGCHNFPCNKKKSPTVIRQAGLSKASNIFIDAE
jgi:hypothetical protein